MSTVTHRDDVPVASDGDMRHRNPPPVLTTPSHAVVGLSPGQVRLNHEGAERAQEAKGITSPWMPRLPIASHINSMKRDPNPFDGILKAG